MAKKTNYVEVVVGENTEMKAYYNELHEVFSIKYNDGEFIHELSESCIERIEKDVLEVLNDL